MSLSRFDQTKNPLWVYEHIVIQIDDPFRIRFEQSSVPRIVQALSALNDMPHVERSSPTRFFHNKCGVVFGAIVNNEDFDLPTRRDEELLNALQRASKQQGSGICRHKDGTAIHSGVIR